MKVKHHAFADAAEGKRVAVVLKSHEGRHGWFFEAKTAWPDLVSRISHANGSEEIEFRSGGRVLLWTKAQVNGHGRGRGISLDRMYVEGYDEKSLKNVLPFLITQEHPMLAFF